ncbi:MAG: 4-hydroxythreonine-4-phosphate dehydrogenase PdxA [Elusimicrobia bacterium]|nr:4-hydroxythreonine-4-phosphate dehydrogenase PdxA [Elusimicrobiota bacterium]
MSRSKGRILAITLGDPAGIGPEVAAKALSVLRWPRGVEPLVIGNEKVFDRFWPRQKDRPAFLHLASSLRGRHVLGSPTRESGRDSLLYLQYAVDLLKENRVHGLVTGPVSKESVARFSPGFRGHTTFLAEAFDRRDVEMLFVADDLRMVLVTRHVALSQVPKMVTVSKLLSVLRTSHCFLVEHLRVRHPRIAVLGLNPHAGEAGHMGREEDRVIAPALRKARALDMDVQGPFPADTFFEVGNRKGYDLIVAMYHDQGLVALKALYFDRLVNLTAGLPFIRTSPAHGTAFGIAGKGVAHPGSMRAAIDLAARLVGA